MFSGLVSSSLDSSIHVWDVLTGQKIRTMENGPMECWTVAFSPDGQKIISGSNAGKIHVYNVETGQQEEQLDTRGKYTLSIAYVRIAIFLKKIYNEYYTITLTIYDYSYNVKYILVSRWKIRGIRCN